MLSTFASELLFLNTQLKCIIDAFIIHAMVIMYFMAWGSMPMRLGIGKFGIFIPMEILSYFKLVDISTVPRYTPS